MTIKKTFVLVVLTCYYGCKKNESIPVSSANKPPVVPTQSDIIANGGFELTNSDGFAKDWDSNNPSIIKIDSINRKSGKNSLHIYKGDGMTVWGEIELTQLIVGSKMEKGKAYTFGFWMKNEKMDGGEIFNIFIAQNSSQLLLTALNAPRDSSGWKLYEFNFIPDLSETIYSYKIDLGFQRTSFSGTNPTGPLSIWLDDMYIKTK